MSQPMDARIRTSTPTRSHSPAQNASTHANAGSPSPMRRSGSNVSNSGTPHASPSQSPSPSPSTHSIAHTNLDTSFSSEFQSNEFPRAYNFVNSVRLKVVAEYGRQDHTAVLHQDSMYVYGGVNADNDLPPNIHVFDFGTRSFSSIQTATGPTPRYQHAAVVSDNQMFVLCGGAVNGLLNDIHAFSFETQTWREIVPSTNVRPPPRRGHCAVIIGRSIYLFGGYGDNGPLEDLFKFDLDREFWTLVRANGATPQPRFLHSGCVYKGQFCVFGGTNIDFVFCDMFLLNCETNTWVEVIVPPETFVPSPRCSHSATMLYNSMIIIGGATNSDLLDAFEFFFETKEWVYIDLGAQAAPRQGHSAVLRGESIFLFGGLAGANHNQLDMLSLGSRDQFEDDPFQESAQDDELARMQFLPPSMWEATLLKKHPDILQYHELSRSLTAVQTYARSRPCATTEDPAHIHHQLVLDMIVEYLHTLGCSRSAKAILDESRLPYFPLKEQPTESRLVHVLKVLKAKGSTKSIFDASFERHDQAQVPDQEGEDKEVELVDHAIGAGRSEGHISGEDEVDIWAEPEDSRANILRTQDGTVRAANLNKLVQALTMDREKAPDVVFLKTFFYTYQSFTSAEMVLKKLIQKYHVRPERSVVDDRYKAEVMVPVQTRMCRVLKFWIEQCPWDFNGPLSEKLLYKLNAFIDGPLTRDGNSNLVKQLRNSISKSMKKKSNNGEETITAGFNPPEPKTPRNLFSHSLSLKDIDEVEIARQLTLIEFRVFASITPPELLSKGWGDPNPKKSPHIKTLITRSYDLSRWVALTILQSESKVKSETRKARAKILEKWIKVADQLKQMRNFQTTASITAGFCHPSIARLGQTFGEISLRAKELYQELVLFAKDDKTYRDIMMTNSSVPCIPNMDISLTDLATVQSNTPDNLNNLIHFQKYQQIFHHILKIQEFQQRQYNLLHVHQIAALLNKLPKTTDKDLDDLSRKCE